MLLLLWQFRRRSRAPLAAALFFGGTLFPVLGFFNVYPFRYSFVADHFQYLACLGPIVLVSSGIGVVLRQWARGARCGGYASCVALLAIMAAFARHQSRMYTDAETLYRTTIARNQGCWMAHNNLGVVLAGSGRLSEAIEHYRAAVQIWPDDPDAIANWALALYRWKKYPEAVDQYQLAVRLRPMDYKSRLGLGLALSQCGRYEDAVGQYRAAVQFRPESANAHYNWALALEEMGKLSEAIEHYAAALQIRPDNVDAHNNLGVAMAQQGRISDAIHHFRAAIDISPSDASLRDNLAALLYERGKDVEALAEYHEALRYQPRSICAAKQDVLDIGNQPRPRGSGRSRGGGTCLSGIAPLQHPRSRNSRHPIGGLRGGRYVCRGRTNGEGGDCVGCNARAQRPRRSNSCASEAL